MTTADPFDLDRFLAAQDAGGTYDRAAAELRLGRKSGHWMWFVFPQIAGLGFSPVSRQFAIRSLAEARAYLDHPVLGPRLVECAQILTQGEALGRQTPAEVRSADASPQAARSAERIFGGIDAIKLRSSMTLFRHADPGQPLFGAVLDLYFDGQSDPLTDEAVQAAGEGSFPRQ